MNLAVLYREHFPKANLGDFHLFLSEWDIHQAFVPHPDEETQFKINCAKSVRIELAKNWIIQNSEILNNNNMEKTFKLVNGMIDNIPDKPETFGEASERGYQENPSTKFDWEAFNKEQNRKMRANIEKDKEGILKKMALDTEERFMIKDPTPSSHSNIKRYRKKPVEIDAIQLTQYTIQECYDFIDPRFGNFPEIGRGIDPVDGKFKITTLEGIMVVEIGDYIIKGVKGEFYPCKEDIFKMTYENVPF